MKVAIVHDFLVEIGGAEQVLKSLHHLYPEAPIYTLLYNKEKIEGFFDNADIRVSSLQKIYKFFHKLNWWWLFPLMPIMPETFDLRDFDLVISSSSSFAKGVITKPKTIHVCFCHSPMRFVWDWYHESVKTHGNLFTKFFFMLMMNYLRIWDRSSAERVDYFVANSRITAERIKKYYKKKSLVIYPPVNISSNTFLQKNESRNFDANSYFLIISRLSKYKRIDLAIEAFNKLQLPLVIIGEGKEYKNLKNIASANIKFLGFLKEEEKINYLKNCYALIFPGEDDFGITAIEAMNYGKPVLAYRKGGVTETVIEGKTGDFFDAPTPEILAEGVRRVMNHYDQYDPIFINAHSQQFSEENFEIQFKHFIDRVIEFHR